MMASARHDLYMGGYRAGLGAFAHNPTVPTVPRQDVLLGYGRVGLGQIVTQHLQGNYVQTVLRNRAWHLIGQKPGGAYALR